MKPKNPGIRPPKWMLVAAMFLLIGNLWMGCASHSETSIKKEAVTSPTSQSVVVEKETTTVHDEPHGVVGGVFHIVGEVLAFPFQLIADVFRFIF